jgi:HSP20 family molecular chaperone IbpA
MKNKINFIFLSYVITGMIPMSAKELVVEPWEEFEKSWKEMEASFDQRFQEMQAQIKQAQESAAKALKQADQSVKAFSSTIVARPEVKLQEDSQVVLVTINLGAGEWLSKDINQVDVEAKGKALVGRLQSGNYQLKFTVTDGQALLVSTRYDQTKDSDDKNKNARYAQQMHSSSSQSVILPCRVDRLEKTKAEFKDGKLLLELPKMVDGSKAGWHKIEVK